jgi:hypothetical protein
VRSVDEICLGVVGSKKTHTKVLVGDFWRDQAPHIKRIH